MWPGIRPATGWIAYLTSTPRLLEELGQLADGVLGLGDREAVARDDDHVLGVGQLDRGVVDADLADGAALRADRPATVPSPPPNPPIMMLITERFMASAMSLVRIAPDAPTRAPAMIRTGLSMTKPAIATAVPVKLFSRRDDDRHVGAADRQRHRDAEDQGRGEDDQHHRDVRRAGREQDRSPRRP